ncbi:MAG: hypothetical protein AB7K24_17780 [Gemmataceae bacterium]
MHVLLLSPTLAAPAFSTSTSTAATLALTAALPLAAALSMAAALTMTTALSVAPPALATSLALTLAVPLMLATSLFLAGRALALALGKVAWLPSAGAAVRLVSGQVWTFHESFRARGAPGRRNIVHHARMALERFSPERVKGAWERFRPCGAA